ncbi:hypothetical protein [Pacificispira spongiicola]|uniref:hypothetical protein n=1 Tax=Pacificispira spongiicola TaxID=2729598 RepID=UPI001D0C08F8|nr:hypothetical protein [Pacificispira spongiicola]
MEAATPDGARAVGTVGDTAMAITAIMVNMVIRAVTVAAKDTKGDATDAVVWSTAGNCAC